VVPAMASRQMPRGQLALTAACVDRAPAACYGGRVATLPGGGHASEHADLRERSRVRSPLMPTTVR